MDVIDQYCKSDQINVEESRQIGDAFDDDLTAMRVVLARERIFTEEVHSAHRFRGDMVKASWLSFVDQGSITGHGILPSRQASQCVSLSKDGMNVSLIEAHRSHLRRSSAGQVFAAGKSPG